ncbi:MAG TPA: metallophosphoesterase family protein [Vicinamibacterales bacterium]|jgi:diadenosine tetraphosphatase ApaH/serine/threonine PP2A family protein phosphatase
MRVAVLNDIHANLPALDAVLAELGDQRIDRIVLGGDVLPGPMPRDTLERLHALDVPVSAIYGNGELAVLAQLDAADPAAVTYWGTTSGAPLPEKYQEWIRWTARQLRPDQADTIRRWPKTLRLDIDTVGDVLFCHGTPTSETDAFTRLTPEDVLLPLFVDLGAPLVVCGHTHMQFDRMIGTTRVVNAGSVGCPFGRTGADWLLLGPGVELRHTSYDLQAGAAAIRATAFPGAPEFADTNVLNPPSEEAILAAFTRASF